MRRKPKKKFYLFLLLALITLISLSGTSFAALDENPIATVANKKIDLGAARYYDAETGQTLTSIYEITDNGLREVSFKEFKAQRDKQKGIAQLESEQNHSANEANNKKSSTSLVSPMFVWNTYYESYHTDPYYGTAYAVTNPLGCPTSNTISCAITRTISTSQAETFSANVTSDMKAGIKAGAGFSWTTSATVTSTYTVTVKPGATGTIMFQPYFKYTYGELKWYNNGYYYASDWVSGKSPKTLATGELAGYVYGVVS